MTWVKICGMTNLEDALIAVEAGADAVGFVFYEKSPRNISVEAAREIVEKLPERVEKVGVFVGATAETVREISVTSGLSAVHRSTRISAIALVDFKRSIRRESVVSGNSSRFPKSITGEESDNPVSSRIFECPKGSGIALRQCFSIRGTAAPGGTGKTFDWRSGRLRTRCGRQRSEADRCRWADSGECGGGDARSRSLGESMWFLA